MRFSCMYKFKNIITMNLNRFLLFFTVILSLQPCIFLSSFKSELTIPKVKSHHDLKHSAFLLQQPRHNLRHQLAYTFPSIDHEEQYIQVPLKTNHIAFQLHLQINGIRYDVNVDTGSSDFWIKGEDAKGDPLIRYSCNCNYRQQKSQYSMEYLDGPIKMYASDIQVKFQDYEFTMEGLITYQSGAQFDDVQGIIGLSYPSKAHHHPNLLEALIDNDIIQKYAYGFNFNLIQDNRSFINFGQADQQLYIGELSLYPLISKSQIKIDFNYLTIGDSSTQIHLDNALIDTGNTCISIPIQHEQEILKQFNTQSNTCIFMEQENVDQFKLMNCKIGNFDQLPNIQFYFDEEGQQYQISYEYYLQFCIEHWGYHYCSTYLETVDVYWEKYTLFLGDGFLNRFYVYLDIEEEKVGIATNNEHITLSDVMQIQGGRFDPEDWKGL